MSRDPVSKKGPSLPPRLYHYTSIQTLALILSTKTIRFTRLDRLNDLDEAGYGHTKGARQCVFASCWTDYAEESVPLWNLYTPQMSGCRIGISCSLFGHLAPYYRGGLCADLGYHLVAPITEYDDYEASRVFGPSAMTYTNSPEILYPEVFADYDDKPDCWRLGLSKRPHWEFEHEWRFRLISSVHHFAVADDPDSQPFGDRVDFLDEEDFCSPEITDLYVDVPCSEEAFTELEVRLGPRCTGAERIITEALLDRYASKAELSNSALRIREDYRLLPAQ